MSHLLVLCLMSLCRFFAPRELKRSLCIPPPTASKGERCLTYPFSLSLLTFPYIRSVFVEDVYYRQCCRSIEEFEKTAVNTGSTQKRNDSDISAGLSNHDQSTIADSGDNCYRHSSARRGNRRLRDPETSTWPLTNSERASEMDVKFTNPLSPALQSSPLLSKRPLDAHSPHSSTALSAGFVDATCSNSYPTALLPNRLDADSTTLPDIDPEPEGSIW